MFCNQSIPFISLSLALQGSRKHISQSLHPKYSLRNVQQRATAQSKSLFRKAVLAEGFRASAEVNGLVWTAETPELCSQSRRKPAPLRHAVPSQGFTSGTCTSTTVFLGISHLSGGLSRETHLIFEFYALNGSPADKLSAGYIQQCWIVTSVINLVQK